MKQRITIEQLEELTDEQKMSLRNWWHPVYGDFFSNGFWANIIQSEEDGSIRCVSTDQDGSYDYESKAECLPILSIGQMIELLRNKGNDWYDIKDIVISTNDFKMELADELWQEVKRVL